ncbi:HECT E3 ubiquitin [Raphidocelis subcapitata]|uniref:HECT-type E3 ubiquitin transferase n=1 Tax=Raphidocelis subcapitata TaxID=307507 RepID=A0A2V0P1T8_9CHLO|nr:HECT E3 ubiquitin [Raphidocelis subcapitata]|eukprot:GBF93834.1 HECT E3 ubiquitin [Raphidocelis subcapitata]
MDAVAVELAASVRKAFEELRARGMEANEACAMAIRVAAGAVAMPPPLDGLRATADALRGAAGREPGGSAAVAELRAKVVEFFGSIDAVQAAFWPPAPPPHSDPSPAPAAAALELKRAAGKAAAGRGGLPFALRVDAAAAVDAFEALVALHDSAVDAALEEAAAALASQISAAHGGRGSGGGGFGGGGGGFGGLGLGGSGGGGRFGAGSPSDGGARAGAPAGAAAWPSPGACASPEALCRAAAVALLNPALEDPGAHGALEALAVAVAAWSPAQRQQLVQLLASLDARAIGRAVASCQQLITLTLYTQMAITAAVQSPQRYAFSFCGHPFIYDPASKARVLQLENQITQYNAYESSMMQAMLGGSAMPFLVLRDTLIQVNRAKDRSELRKPLKVQFLGEEGVDEGGVQKEFFQLLVRQAFNPDFGMFVYDESRHLHWFRASGMDLDMEYELIGILIGLAIYNSHILEFQFPIVLYKKLMGRALGLEDLAELHPEVHASLSKLLAMPPGEVEALALTFEVESEVEVGRVAAVELMPGGAAEAVTADNRGDYARLYALHLLEGSVARQFGAFRRGFLQLCSGQALQLFRPAELEQLVCGGRSLDFDALQGAARYDDGYTAASPVVRWFWEVVHSLDEPQRRRLLFFITGSDRVPIKGLAHLAPPLIITPNGGHSDRLPTAHTCFNHLLLPSYRDKETLRARLLLAIENAEGFGLQ